MAFGLSGLSPPVIARNAPPVIARNAPPVIARNGVTKQSQCVAPLNGIAALPEGARNDRQDNVSLARQHYVGKTSKTDKTIRTQNL